MIMKKTGFALICAIALLASCTREMKPDGFEGRGALCIKTAFLATKGSGQNCQNAVVSIFSDTGEEVVEYAIAELPELIYLDAGRYLALVEAGEIVESEPVSASWELNSYRGREEFEIKEGQMSEVSVTATPANIGCRVVFHESIESSFKAGFSFEVRAEGTESLEYTASNSGDCGYFTVKDETSSLYWTFKGNLSINGAVVEGSGSIPGVLPGKVYRMSPKYSSSDGFISFEAAIDDSVEEFDHRVEINPFSGKICTPERCDLWCTHARLKIEIDESCFDRLPEVLLSYGTGGEWVDVPAERVAAGIYEARLTQLDADTEYTCRLLVNGNEMIGRQTFRTEAASQIPNGDFETVSHAQSSKYYSFYDPSSQNPALRERYWDSANPGSGNFGIVVCSSSSDVPPGTGSSRSVVLTSRNAIVKFAAGSMFVGEFSGLSGMNGIVHLGRYWPSGSRPSAVRFWYKYKGGKVNFTSKDCPLTKNDYDVMKIEVALGNWPASRYGGTAESPILVNTGDKSTFRDFTTLPETVASCRFSLTGDGKLGHWTQVTLPLEYRNEGVVPSHLLVSMVASAYGDYFAGSDESQLSIDNLEFIYE